MPRPTTPYRQTSSFSFGPGPLSTALKALIGVNVVMFLATTFLPSLQIQLGLVPQWVLHDLRVYQVVTYMFIHAGLFHILFNMLALWMFGTELERLWGTRRFLQFYFFCGIGAGVCVIVANYLFGNPNVATVGSSGAIYGLLLASAVLWPDRQILFSFLIPIKMKYFVIIIGAIAFLNSFNPASPVSDVAHLGGMLFGYVFLKIPKQALAGSRRGPRVSITGSLRNAYRDWKLARAKRKFEVYMRKQKSDRDPWVN